MIRVERKMLEEIVELAREFNADHVNFYESSYMGDYAEIQFGNICLKYEFNGRMTLYVENLDKEKAKQLIRAIKLTLEEIQEEESVRDSVD